jgi:diguanylate cyclase (GGDEF)-like protein/PAS domain S-box-containing protein
MDPLLPKHKAPPPFWNPPPSFLRQVIDTDPNFIFVKDTEGRFLLANQAVAEVYGITPEELVGKTDADFNPNAEEIEQFRKSEIDLLRSGQEQIVYEEAITDAQGKRRWLQTVKRPLYCDQTGALQILGVCSDITDRKTVEEDLRRSRKQLQSLTDNVPVLIARVDTDLCYVFANGTYYDFFGLPAADVLGRTLAEVLGEAAFAIVQPYVARVFAGECVTYDAQIPFRKLGTRFLHVSYVPEYGDNGEVTGFLLSAADVTAYKVIEEERERLLEEAVRLADHDPLTGLLNHRAFHKRLEEEADRAQRQGTTLAVVMADLDNFKFFNDAYGHLAGDQVLREIAAGLGGGCRSYDTLARFGGDEFALLLPGLGAEDARQLTERLVCELNRRGFRPPGYEVTIPLGVSFGCAIYPTEAATRLEVVEMADQRLRLAKTRGEAVQIAEQLRAHMASREGFSMLDALVTAVDNKDRYTRKHSEDVLTYSLQIAQALGLTEEAQNTVAVAALLHDVGKIAVPDAILRRPGKLTDAEFEAVKLHPTMGAVIVKAVPGFEQTLDAVRHHHERWDGQGYPSGLQGEAIPLIARLMAVADAFSAMTTDRPYRQGMDRAQALDILQSGAGVQWDPVCVQAFLHAQNRPVETSVCLR